MRKKFLFANLHQLIVLANLETHNALLIKNGVEKRNRLMQLHEIAKRELISLRKSSYTLASIQSPFLLEARSTTAKPGDSKE